MPPKKSKKKQDDYWDSEFQEDAIALGIEPAPAAPAAAALPPIDGGAQASNADDDHDAGFGLMAQVKRAAKNKKKPEPVAAVPTQPADGADGSASEGDNGPVVTIKTKAQKEKEKKERQKLAKKLAAAKDGPAGGANDQTANAGSLPAAEEGKKKKGAAAAPVAEEPAGKGKKKGGPPVAALKKLLEAQKAAEAQRLKEEEEEQQRIDEEIRKREEEERAVEEIRQKKREKEKAKREQLRKDGKLLTKAQKEAQQRAQQRLQALLDSGVKVAAFAEPSAGADGAPAKKKVVYDSRKKKKTPDQGAVAQQDLTATTAVEAKKETKDSWDASSSEDDVKDAWDATSSESSAEEEVEAESVSEGSGSDSDSDESENEPSKAASQKSNAEAIKTDVMDNLRSPICVILGHVDTGKTKLLDKIRQTNVQEGEAGGITQQIGATYFPIDIVKQKTSRIPMEPDAYKVPGLLVIDTPGHESFTNLRSRGSSLCNIAILVVDIMHGLEPQTLESLRLLRDRKTPFIVALNKIDRIYDWKATPDYPFQETFKAQSKHVKAEFNDRVQKTILEFNMQGLNACLHFENKNFAKNVSLVPTSAITGEGIPDLLHLLIHLTQTRMSNKLMYLSKLECTVLEVKMIEGLGTTIDVILSNGVLNEGERIVICGLNGPIVTNIRALLTPQPLRELRVKSAYVHHKSIKAAMGVKISAPDLEKAIAGSRLLVIGPDDDEEDLMDDVMSDLQILENAVDKTGRGVSVQASTLGSLEALLEFLRVSKIPVAAINIGPVHKKDVIRCATMLERAKEFAVMLCFDVKVDKEAQEIADDMGVTVFKADIIYHLFDQFVAYNKDIVEQKRKDQAPQAVFPCILRVIPGAVFNKRDPIIVGCDVLDGTLRIGTPICVVHTNAETGTREVITLGKVGSIEQNHKALEVVKKGQAGGGVAVRIDAFSSEAPRLFGRHFTEKDELYSLVSRQSIDVLKTSFRDDVSKDEWALIVRLKKLLEIA